MSELYDYRQAISRSARYRAAVSFLQFLGVIVIGVLLGMSVWLLFYVANGGFEK